MVIIILMIIIKMMLVVVIIIAIMIMVLKIILLIVVVIIKNSPFQPGDFSTGSTTDVPWKWLKKNLNAMQTDREKRFPDLAVLTHSN